MPRTFPVGPSKPLKGAEGVNIHPQFFKFGTTAQIGIADLETRLFDTELAAFEPGDPVFVTSLPRAGTTILLEILAALPEFATHTYRDMPMVLCPMLWSRIEPKGAGARVHTHVSGPESGDVVL